VFDVNGCRLVVKYVGVCVCVWIVLTFIKDSTESQAVYKLYKGIPDSLVGIVTRLPSGPSGVRTPTATRDLSALLKSRLDLGFTQPFVQGVVRFLPGEGGKVAGARC
jgi:hypothetical protein